MARLIQWEFQLATEFSRTKFKASACYLRPLGYAINICPFYLAAKASDKKAIDA